jgi:membrane-associated phospholipid phosphatase
VTVVESASQFRLRLPARGLRLIDRLLLGYLAIGGVIALVRANQRPAAGWAVVAYSGIAALVLLLARPGHGILGRALREVYPLLLLVPLYSSLDLINGIGQVPVHDVLIRQWEAALFGGQVSQTWWQQSHNPFFSWLFHLSYFSYYLIIPLPFAWFAVTGDGASLRRSVLIIFATYLVCYLWFIFFPVAGPYYEFPRPAAWFLDNGPARVVYATLSTGSSYGAAFPSSHVAATVSALIAGWLGSRTLGWILAIPTVLLTIGVVYCQMHYAVDAVAGVALGSVIALGLARVGHDRRLIERK